MRKNNADYRTHTVGTSMTDQAGADATDINIIMKKYLQSGTVPGSATPPIYADFSEIPDNLRDMIHMSRELDKHRNELPNALKGLSTTEILNTPPQRLQEMITEEARYTERHAKLPNHFKSMSRQDILALTDEQLTNIITPPAPPAPQGPKT